MRLRLPPSLNPFAGALHREALVLRTLRLTLVVCGGLLPVFGLAFRLASADVIDPWGVRLVWTALCLVLLAATYRVEWVRTVAPQALHIVLSGMLVWLGILVYANDLGPEIALGYLFTYAAVGSILGLTFDRFASTAASIIVGAGVAAVSGFSVHAPAVSPGFFVFTVAVTGGILLSGTLARLRDREVLDARDHLLRTAETLGQLGSWSYDIATGQRQWSEGMYGLVGQTASLASPPPLSAVLPEAEVLALTALETDLLSSGASTAERTLRLHPFASAPIEVRATVRSIRTAGGPPRGIVGVLADVTAQVERERELERAKEEAESVAALKSAILENMNHEIRTPLTAVIGYAQLLRMDAPDHLLDLVTPIETGGHRLLETLNAILDLARLEAGVASLSADPFDATPLLNDATRVAREQAHTQGLVFTTSYSASPLAVSGDPDALRCALDHLIGNALKFTEAGGIAVAAEVQDGWAEIRVSDTGPGIAPEFMERLFEPFHQESTGTRRLYEGSGLGLAVSHRLITAMGGAITASSVVGEGTTMTLRLPLAAAPEPRETAWISRPGRPRAAGADPVSADASAAA